MLAPHGTIEPDPPVLAAAGLKRSTRHLPNATRPLHQTGVVSTSRPAGSPRPATQAAVDTTLPNGDITEV
jgi:hypothetical protein